MKIRIIGAAYIFSQTNQFDPDDSIAEISKKLVAFAQSLKEELENHALQIDDYSEVLWRFI